LRLFTTVDTAACGESSTSRVTVIIVQARYRYRIEPTEGQRLTLTRTFGCARVVFNDAIRCREGAKRAGEKVSPSEVQLAKRRAGRPVGRPKFKSRKDNRQSFRLTRNGFSLHPNGKLYIAKVGDSIWLASSANSRGWNGRKPGGPREAGTGRVEDPNIAGMVKNRRLARPIHDAGWAQFVRLLEKKAERYGRIVHKVSRWLPSSKTCSTCGHVMDEMSLKIREWCCPSCGTAHDRDHNAALNILAAGRAERRNACGAGVSLPPGGGSR
jgi:transposase